MLNYIPEDFFSAKKTVVYSSEKDCLKAEGTAISFNAKSVDLSESDIVGGAVVQDLTKKGAKDKAKQIEAKYEELVNDVYDSMESTFGTRNDVSAAAFASTWEAMVKRPASFVDASLGLSDEAAVTAYATPKLAAADAYGVYRLKRIAQFESDKATILAS